MNGVSAASLARSLRTAIIVSCAGECGVSLLAATLGLRCKAGCATRCDSRARGQTDKGSWRTDPTAVDLLANQSRQRLN